MQSTYQYSLNTRTLFTDTLHTCLFFMIDGFTTPLSVILLCFLPGLQT